MNHLIRQQMTYSINKQYTCIEKDPAAFAQLAIAFSLSVAIAPCTVS
ncbi:MAG: hypothetical protein F6K00_16035 [Leptolyngbya sp. SIOISBB]|nr:hypothetical protein [Leptolyngbya sp. SIOISBB]